jgi:RNA polymerase sigma factor (sigma-70 family)
VSTSSPAEREELNGLLIRAGRGDQQAFAALYQRTSSKLFGACLRMLRERGEAEEVLQETYIVVWRRAASFDAGKASAITWLVTLTRDKAIDRLRRHHEEQARDPLLLEDIVDMQPTPASDAETSQERQRLQRCLDALEPPQRSAVREVFFHRSDV